MSARRTFSIATLLWTLLALSHAVELSYITEKPDFLLTCKIYQPGFNECSTNSIQKLMDEMVKGIPLVQERVGSLEPMKLERIIFKQDSGNSAVTIEANLTNILMSGFSKMVIKDSKVSKKDFGWETKIFLPRMRIDADYKMRGRILLIPLNGGGKMFLDIENLDILLRAKTRLYEKGGFTFYNVTRTRVNLSMTGVKTYFDNIFNGNSKEVERSTNEFFNKNWQDFFEALRPLIAETVERTLLQLLQTTFHIIPANFFIEDIPSPKEFYSKHKKD